MYLCSVITSLDNVDGDMDGDDDFYSKVLQRHFPPQVS